MEKKLSQEELDQITGGFNEITIGDIEGVLSSSKQNGTSEIPNNSDKNSK